jgi:type II secretory pathway component PulF
MVNPAARVKTPTLGIGSAAVEFRVKAIDRRARRTGICPVECRPTSRTPGASLPHGPARHFARARPPLGLWSKPQPRVPLVNFSQELVALLDAGLSLVESIEALTEKEHSAAVRRRSSRFGTACTKGKPWAPRWRSIRIFPHLYVATVRASERTGSLREALARFITYQQQIDSLRKTFVNASIYPAVLAAREFWSPCF